MTVVLDHIIESGKTTLSFAVKPAVSLLAEKGQASQPNADRSREKSSSPM
jgi:hypothetical protein